MTKTMACKKSILNFKFVRDFSVVPVRQMRSRWLGYYERRIPTPFFEERKADYRERVLQPLETMPNLEQRLKEMNAKDPILDARVNIGLPSPQLDSSRIPVKERLVWQKNIKRNKEMEKIARARQLKIDLDKVKQEWQATSGADHLFHIADHYGIYKDMFDHGYFLPRVPLNVYYPQDEDHVLPVCMGNILQSIQAEKDPDVEFGSSPDDMWTLVLTNIDGHLLDTNSEYLLWFVGNIKGSDISTGEVVCDYLRPFPMRGSGYHRNVFVLYKQDGKIDYSSIKKEAPCVNLKERTFKTFDFYKEHQDFLTPAGLSFYQCIWDKSLTHFFHNILNMREPSYEYNEWQEYVKPQVQYPHKNKPFNLYLDQYRDPKEIKKEVLLTRLASIHPFKKEPPMPKYPCLHKPEGRIWSWQKDDIRNKRLRLGKYRDLRPASVYPQEDNQGRYSRKA